MRMQYPNWLKIVMIALAFAAMAYISFTAARADVNIGGTVYVSAFCDADTKDVDKPAQPSWSDIRHAIERADDAAYMRIMRDPKSTCVDLRLLGNPRMPKMLPGKLIKRYHTFKTPDGKCRSMVKVRVPNPRGSTSDVFTWIACLPEA